MGVGQSHEDVVNRVIAVPKITVPKRLLMPLPKVDTSNLAAMAKTLPAAVKAATENDTDLAKHVGELKQEIQDLQKQLTGLLELQQHIRSARDMYTTRLTALGSLTQAKDKNRLVSSQTAALASRIGTGV